MNRTITAYYDNRAEAERAADRLAEAGVQRTDVTIHGTDATSGTATTTRGEDKGFWESSPRGRTGRGVARMIGGPPG